MRVWALVCLVFLSVAGAGAEDAAPSVGMTGRVEGVFLPGEELEPAPIADDGVAVVVRITETYPRADGFAYDLEYYGLEPGEHNLVDYLRRKDGVELAAGDLPAVNVAVRSLLPPGQVEPRELGRDSVGVGWGYQAWLVTGAVLWVLVLVWLVFGGKKKGVDPTALDDEEATVADRLRPLVEQARDGVLTVDEQARVERLLLSFWRERLGLGGRRPEEAMAMLRDHDEAGALLRQLEAWLHRPGGADGDDVDLAGLLEPYGRAEAVPATGAADVEGRG